MNQTQDFSKLADFNIVHERKRLNSEKSSDGSDFLGWVQFFIKICYIENKSEIIGQYIHIKQLLIV